MKDLQKKMLSQKLTVKYSGQKVSDKSTLPKPKTKSVVPNKKPKTNAVILNAASTSKQEDIVIEVQNDYWFCSVCEEIAIEDMVQCLLCAKWVHETCAGSKAKIRKFVCSNCSS